MKNFIMVVGVALLFIPGLAFAVLTPKDDVILTDSLETVSAGGVQSDADSATTILCKVNSIGQPVYTSSDWESWFNKFFNTSNHSYTDSLAKYLVNPIFGWCHDTTRRNLQMGLINPLWTKISNITFSHPADLGIAMYDDASMRQTLFNAHIFFALLMEKETVDLTTRTNIYINYKNYIKAYLQYFSDTTTIDNFEQPLVSLLRAQVWMSFGQALPLAKTRKGDVATTIGLGLIAQRKLDIWNAFTVLVIDNNGLDLIQLNEIYDLLNGIPAKLHNLRYVTVRDFLIQHSSWRVILSKGEPINYYLAITPDNTVRFVFQNTNRQEEVFSTHKTLDPDGWNHIAVTFDGNKVAMYINGQEDVTYSAKGLPYAGSLQPLELGRRIRASQWMRGKLDDVKIYGRALSGKEVSDEYNNRPVSAIDLIVDYKMNKSGETFGANSFDLGNNGSQVNWSNMSRKVNDGLFFNGKDDYVEVPDNPSLRLANAMTVEAWIYFVNEEEKWSIPGGSGGVNIFGMRVGAMPGNPFPSDVTVQTGEGFSGTAVHEFNHVVDSFYVVGDDARKTRRTQLIDQAGFSPLQYLRSMFVDPDGKSYFQTAPQEFFASISQEYFSDSWHTFDLAVQRFNKGYREPINQFLFFADVYSEGGLTTKFYTLDKEGILTVNDVPIYRDLFGHITEITRAGTNTVYRFILDYNGNVLYYRTEPDKKY